MFPLTQFYNKDSPQLEAIYSRLVWVLIKPQNGICMTLKPEKES